ncbi:hypothetical protein HDU79_002194 [Rhizoclosmatium sp. JEL0117]|nr:hypothetical protein HDU79_002194 [Rhizoclosmatium sp. JEL0117]
MVASSVLAVSNDDQDDDATLARILQEEEDNAFLEQSRREASNLISIPPRPSQYNNNPPYNLHTSMYTLPTNQPTMHPNYSAHTPTTFPAQAASFSVGTPYHTHGFPLDTTPTSRFSTTETRDLDICIWGRDCITVMESTNRLFHINLISHEARYLQNWRVQRTDADGPTVFVITKKQGNALAPMDTVALFDASVGKVIACKGKGEVLNFSTVSGSEKLVWKDGELRVNHGFFGKKGAGDDSTDLFAYVVRKGREDGNMVRYRVRVGGRGLNKVDLICSSFVAMLLLEMGTNV